MLVICDSGAKRLHGNSRKSEGVSKARGRSLAHDLDLNTRSSVRAGGCKPTEDSVQGWKWWA